MYMRIISHHRNVGSILYIESRCCTLASYARSKSPLESLQDVMFPVSDPNYLRCGDNYASGGYSWLSIVDLYHTQVLHLLVTWFHMY